MVDQLSRTDSQTSISSIFSDGTNSNFDEALILSDASVSDDDDQPGLREESILDTDKTVEDNEMSEIELTSAESDEIELDADDELTREKLPKKTDQNQETSDSDSNSDNQE